MVPDPAIFVMNLQDANKKLIFKSFSAYYFLKDKKKSQNTRNYYFCLMIEGSGSGDGSVPLTSGSGSRRPKNIWIRRIRIRNTALLMIFLVSIAILTAESRTFRGHSLNHGYYLMTQSALSHLVDTCLKLKLKKLKLFYSSL
jgi:hypothetical protein